MGGRLYRRNRRHLRAGRENHTLERGLVDIEIYFEEELEEPVRDDDEPENREQSQPEGREYAQGVDAFPNHLRDMERGVRVTMLLQRRVDVTSVDVI